MISGALTRQKTDNYTDPLRCPHGRRVRDTLMALEMLCKGDMMRKVLSAAGAVAVVAAIGATVAGCSQIGMLKGKMAFRDANALYGGENWAAAAKRYEEALAAGCVNDQ